MKDQIKKNMKIPITQGREWQKLQDDLKTTSFFEKTDTFQYLAIKHTTPVGDYLYLPYGPLATTEQGIKQSLKSLLALARREHAIFVRIEPQNLDFAKHLPRSAIKTKDLSPADTWVLDLPKITTADPLENRELKALLPSRLLRYYKSRLIRGITIETSHSPSDIHYLLDLQKSLAQKKHIRTFSEHYLKTELSQPFATLYLVKYQNPAATSSSTQPSSPKPTLEPEVIAAGLVFDHQKTRYNLQGAQSDFGRKLHATGILTIQLILDAAQNGLATFDFWGIAPDGAPSSHPWAGFTDFKKSFAGTPKHYLGTYDLVISPFRYKLFHFLRRLKH